MVPKLKNNTLNVILIIIICLIILGCNNTTTQNLDSFASCLKDKGAIMYGASWCSHCAEQKEKFGSSFSNVNYVECEEQKDLCAKEKIQYLPTWQFADGTVVTGVQELSYLAEKTGCSFN